MLFDESYPIDQLSIPWGKSLLEVAALTPGREWHRDDTGWPSLRGACQSVGGLAATECFLRAPAPHKPVLRVEYTLAPSALHLDEAATPAYWFVPISQLLGPPAEATSDTEQMRPERGALLFRAVWLRTWHHISLLVYRSTQPQSTELTATLSLEWEDVLTAARPFVAALQVQEAILDAAARRSSALEPFELRERQPGDGPAPTANPDDPKAQLRQAEWALRHSELYRTPAPLWAQLSDRQVALWLVSGEHGWALSTKWYTVLVPGHHGPGLRIDLVTTRPAKGGGFMSLGVGELVLYDAYQSPVLGQLAAELEIRVGATVVHFESHDC